MCDIEVAVICRAVSKIKRLILLLCHFSGAYQKDYQKQFSNTILTKLESLQTEFNIFADKNCRKDFSNITSIIRKQCNDFSLNKDSNEDVIVIEDIGSAIALQEDYDSFMVEKRIPDEELDEILNKAIKNIKKSLGIR